MGYSKEPSQYDGSFEHPKCMFKSMGRKINAILGSQTIFVWTYGSLWNSDFKSIHLFIFIINIDSYGDEKVSDTHENGIKLLLLVSCLNAA